MDAAAHEPFEGPPRETVGGIAQSRLAHAPGSQKARAVAAVRRAMERRAEHEAVTARDGFERLRVLVASCH